MNRLPGGPIPDQRGLALVGDADGGDLAPPHLRRRQGALDGLDHALPDLLGLVLDPPGLREMLRELAGRAAEGAPLDVHDRARWFRSSPGRWREGVGSWGGEYEPPVVVGKREG